MSVWRTLFTADCTLDLTEEMDMAKHEVKKKSTVDSHMSNVEISPNVAEHLNNKFVPCDKLKTPFLKDCVVPEVKKMYLENKNVHPRDSRIVSLDDPHCYFIDGNCDNIVSSTSFCHAYFPSFDQEKGAAKILSGKTFQKTGHRPSNKYYGCKNVGDVLDRWAHWRDLGTMLHDNIENFINGEEYVLHEENKKAFEKFLKFYEDKAFWYFSHLRTEWAVFDEETRLAGKIDYCGIDPKTGHVIILDWKRVGQISDSCMQRWSKGREPLEMGYDVCSKFENCKYITYSLQLNVYKWILEKNYGLYVKAMYLIQIHPKVKNVTVYKVPNLQKVVVKMAAARKKILMNK
jgi:hypothetical protein